ncbi:MAG: efflux RND transporter periplasmic adaptor subunit [Gemmatimonadota bacterium]|nr:efflux RND transporter periplasmic adaptor subunit [Gemmatimonadota bacterium]
MNSSYELSAMSYQKQGRRGRWPRLSGTSRSAGTAALLLVLTTAAACNRDEARAEPAANNAVVVGPENIAVVRLQDVRTGPLLSGSLQPEQEATVRAELPGGVVQTFADVGQRVARGAILARLDDRAIRDTYLSAQTAVTTAQSNYTVAARELDRAQTLAKAGAIADRDVEYARNAAAAASAQLANARAVYANAAKQLGYTQIRAPFAGVVSQRHVSAGDVVSPGGALFTVVNPASMRLEASVPANELSSVRVGLPVEFSVTGYPNRLFSGRITRVSPTADPTTRQVGIVATIPNAGNTLVGGLFAEGRVASETRTAPVAPVAAVDERGLRPVAMRIKNGRVERVEVQVGIRDEANEIVEIRTGLTPGDTVLLGAARGVSPGTAVTVSAVTDTKG